MSEPVKLLVLEDTHFRTMMNDVKFVAAFPCLASAQKTLTKTTSCTPCEARRLRTTGTDALGVARKCLAGLSKEGKTKLKSMLGARQIRIISRSGGRVVKLTF